MRSPKSTEQSNDSTPGLDSSDRSSPQLLPNRPHIVRRNDRRHSDPHIEHLIHLVARDAAAFLHDLKDGWDFPAAHINHRIAIVRQNTRQIINQSATGNVSKPFQFSVRNGGQKRLIVAMRTQKFLA